MSNETLKVHSSFIKAAMYNSDKQYLRIEIGNHWYYYYGITKQKVARFKNAASKGKYFCEYIKGKYRTIKRTIR